MKELAKQINDKIKESDIYKRYIVSKEEVEKNNELVELANKMKQIKDLNCKSREESLIDEYYELEKKYNSHILVKEYMKNKEDIALLLREVSDILSLN